MKKHSGFLLLLINVLFFNSVFTQVLIPNTTTITETFSIGATATASLPTGWKMSPPGSTAPTYADAGNFTATLQQASSGSPTTGSRYNWGATGGTDRAIGFMTSGSYANPSSIMVEYQNKNAGNMISLTVSYKGERYRQNTAAASIQFFYSLNGSTWTSVSAGDIAAASFPTGANTYGYPLTTVNVSAFTISSLNIATDGFIYLRWNINTTGTNSQGIAIDDVSVTAAFSAAAPTVTTSAPNPVSSAGATFNGTVNANGSSTAVSFQYGLTTGYGSSATAAQSPVSGTSNTAVSAAVSGLSVNTQYNYRVSGTSSGGTSNGSNIAFYTLANVPGAPSVSTLSESTLGVAVSNVNGNPATTQFAIREAGGLYVQTNGSLGTSPIWRTASAWSIITVTGLNPSTSYTFSVKARNGDNVETAFGTGTTGITDAASSPTVSTGTVENIGTTSARLTGMVNAFGSSVNALFHYGPTTGYGSSATASPPVVTGTDDTPVEATISGLGINTQYHFRASINWAISESAHGSNASFYTHAAVPGTLLVSTLPSPTRLSVSLADVNGNPSATVFAIQETSTGQYLQANGTLSATAVWQTAAVWSTTTVTGLSSSTTYTFRIKARNGAGAETAFSGTASATTPSCPAVTGISVSNITNTTAEFNWPATTGEYTYVINTSASAPVVTGTVLTQNTLVATGLTASTGYHFHVRSKCGNNYSAWTSFSFSTVAAPAGFVTFEFTGYSGGTPTSNATSVAANVQTPVIFTRGSGINIPGTHGNDIFNSSNWNATSLAEAQSLNEYHSFSVSPAASYQITYTSVNFPQRSSGTGPRTAQIGYSTNGGITWTLSSTENIPIDPASIGSFKWSFTPFTSSGTVIFRLWAWAATNVSAGTYRNDNVVLEGYVTSICTTPAGQPTNVAVTPLDETSASVSWTPSGISDARYVFMKAATTGFPTLTNGTTYLADNDFGLGSDAGGGWYCVYAGTGTSVTVNNLEHSTTYRAYVVNGNCNDEFSRYNNSTNGSNPANGTMPTPITAVFSSTPPGNFGPICINTTEVRPITVTGINLTGAAASANAPAGYGLSLNAGGPFSSSLLLPYTGEDLSATLYIRFSPLSAQVYSGNIQVQGGGAPVLNVPVSGTAVNTPPEASTQTVSFIGTTNATISAGLTLNCAGDFSEYGVEYSATTAFLPGNGAIIPGTDLSGGKYSVVITGLAINTVYYYRAYGINNSITYYGNTGSFRTLSGTVETIYNYTDNTDGTPAYVHPVLTGSALTKSGFSGVLSPCGSGYSTLGTPASPTYNPATNAYVNFDLEPAVYGNQFTVHSIKVQMRRSATNGARKVRMAYSIDNGATWIDKGSDEEPNAGDCGQVSNHLWNFGTLFTVGAPLTIEKLKVRLYHYDPAGANGNNQILNFSVDGIVLESPSIYYSVTSGNATDAIWSPTIVGAGVSVNFTRAISAVVQNNHTVMLNNDLTVNNFTVNGPSGKLYANATNPASMKYLNLYGNLIVNGSLGNGTTFDAIGIQAEGLNCVISGTGDINPGQVRKSTVVNPLTNLTFQATTVNLRYPGAALYNNAANGRLNINIPAEKTVQVPGSGGTPGDVAIDGIQGSGAGENGGTLSVEGTLGISGKLYAVTNNTNAAYPCVINIGATGRINVKDADIRTAGSADIGFGLNIANGGTLRVAGLARNLEGTFESNNGLILLNGASLLHGNGIPGLGAYPGGNVSGPIKVQRQGSNHNLVYNYWSSPVEGADLSAIGTNSRYYYQPASATGTTLQGLRAGWMPVSGVMIPGKGYISTAVNTTTFTGAATGNNNGLVTLPVTTNPGITRFNLVGNPYPSSLNAIDFCNHNSAVLVPAVYLWDDQRTYTYSPSEYIVSNPVGTVASSTGGNSDLYNGFIASCQGFFVEALNDGDAEIEFTNAMRNATSAHFFEEPSSLSRLWVSVTNSRGDYNETLLAFIPGASDARDIRYDAKKMAGNPNIALYTTIGEDAYAIQSWGELSADRIIPLGLDAGVIGVHTFAIPKMDNIDPTVMIYLEDTETGMLYNLRNGSVSIDLPRISGANRFRLIFKAPVSVTAQPETCAGGDGSIEIDTRGTTWSYVLNNSAREITGSGTATDRTTISGLPAGTYMLELYAEDGTRVPLSQFIEASGTLALSMEAPEQAGTGQQLSFTALPSGVDRYVWNFGDGSAEEEGAVVNHSYLLPGVYTVTLTVISKACSQQLIHTVYVEDNSTGIRQLTNNERAVELYPNPAAGRLFVRLPAAGRQTLIELCDLAGRTLRSTVSSGNGPATLTVNDLSAGIYLVRVHGLDGILTLPVVVTE